jgi:branched-chain amino acid transport system ATP-binding protein/urea transport system ATP-binding protein
MGSSAILTTHGLTRRFGGVTAVDNVDLRIVQGEIRCLIGPNGAGKSTLFKCLTHQLRPTSGEILFRGRNLSGMSSFRIARLGIAIKNQIPSVYAGLSVRENIRLAAMRHHRGAALETAVTSLLEEVSFDRTRSDVPVNTLSHAHKQWAELAMLLASEPDLALLDEPTAGMTRDEMLKTINIIKRLNAKATVVVVEHDLEFIARLAERVTVLHRGAVLVEDTMANIENNQMVRDIYLGKRKDIVYAHG